MSCTLNNRRRHPVVSLLAASCFALLMMQPALADNATGRATLIDLSTEASHAPTNDLIRATMLAEASGAKPGDLARLVNAQIGEALKVAKSYQSVKTKSGSTNSYPVYAKGGKIESWRMRSELVLESSDTAAISELVGKLQGSLGIANLALQPSPETRKTAEDQAILSAIDAFKARATMIAGSFNKTYRIKQLNVSTNGRIAQPMYRAAAKTMSYDSEAIPMESGESQISATVCGQIELE